MDANVEKNAIATVTTIIQVCIRIDNVYTAFNVDDIDDSVKRSNSTVHLVQFNQSIKWQCYKAYISLNCPGFSFYSDVKKVKSNDDGGHSGKATKGTWSQKRNLSFNLFIESLAMK